MSRLEKLEKGYTGNLRNVSKTFPKLHTTEGTHLFHGGLVGRDSKNQGVEIVGKFHFHTKSNYSTIAVAFRQITNGEWQEISPKARNLLNPDTVKQTLAQKPRNVLGEFQGRRPTESFSSLSSSLEAFFWIKVVSRMRTGTMAMITYASLSTQSSRNHP